MSWKRFVPNIGYRRVLIIISLVAITLWGLLLGGCSSSNTGIPNIYILSASYADTTTSSTNSNTSYLSTLQNLTQRTSLDVRTGFFSLCVRIPTAIQGQATWDCGSRATLTERYGPSVDPLDLIGYMDVFANKVVFYGLMCVFSFSFSFPHQLQSQPCLRNNSSRDKPPQGSREKTNPETKHDRVGSIAVQAVVMLILLTFPGWHTTIDEDGSEKEVKPFPSRSLSQVATVLAIFASILGFVSMLWIHVAAAAFAESIEQLLGGLVGTSVGAAVMSLGWVAVFLLAVVAGGLVVMILSIRMLDMLTED